MMPLKVFYLDDEPDLLEMFTDLFSGPDVEIFTCEDVASAREILKAQNFDVGFLDYRLPGTNGDQVALQLRPDQVKVLVMGDLSVITEVKFNALFPKPYKSDAIREFLQQQMVLKIKRPA